jgi:peptidoglycan/LPS O-acetylase OafA/YrhL
MLHFYNEVPVATVLASAFYLSLLVYVTIPSFHAWLDDRLMMPQPSSQSFIQPLEGFRGIAALMVVVFHAWQWLIPYNDEIQDVFRFISRGTKAVPIFVVLSGFLIYRSLRNGFDIDKLQKYVVRRFLRIYPLYAATIIVSLFAGYLAVREPIFQHFLAEILMARTLGYEYFLNPQSWSLYVEVQFYIILPVIVSIFRENRIRWSILVIGLLFLTDFAGPREFGLWKYFFFGIIACEWVELRKADYKWSGEILFGIGMVLFILDYGYGEVWFSNLMNMLFAKNGIPLIMPRGGGANPELTMGLGFAALFLLVGAVTCGEKLRRALAIKPLHYLGVISYSVYMWHSFVLIADFPIIFDGAGSLTRTGEFHGRAAIFVLPFVIIPAVLFVSTASFILIERPFLNLYRSRRQESKRGS